MPRGSDVARLVAVVLIGTAAAGCSSRVVYSPPAAPAAAAEETVTLPLPFDPAWSAVVQTFFDKNIPIKTVEKASGILESDELRGEIGRDCDCGTYLGVPVGGYGGAYGGDAYYRYRVLVQKRADRETTLVLRSTCRARSDRIEGELVCRLDPTKEADIRSAVAARATAAGAASAAPR